MLKRIDLQSLKPSYTIINELQFERHNYEAKENPEEEGCLELAKDLPMKEIDKVVAKI